MPLKDLIQQKIITCGPDTAVRDVSQIMKDKDVGAVIVVDQAVKPLGIVTDRDLVLRCMCEGMGMDTPVQKIMSRVPAMATVEEHGIQDVIKLMRHHAVRRIPIVDRAGKAVALISFGDIVGLLAKELGEISAATRMHAAA